MHFCTMRAKSSQAVPRSRARRHRKGDRHQRDAPSPANGRTRCDAVHPQGWEPEPRRRLRQCGAASTFAARMAFALVHSRALRGLESPAVTVEVHLANGLPSFTLVGLADTEVKESRERVRAALQTSGLEFPHNKRVIVSLAPADLPKESGRFDLPIALGILAAAGQLDAARLERFEFAGELSLAGELRPVHGALAMALALGRMPAATAADAGPAAGERRRVGARRRHRGARRASSLRRRARLAARRCRRRERPARGEADGAAARRPPSPTCATCAARPPPSARSRSRRPAS